MGGTAIQNTPTLRAYNEGGHPVDICGSIRGSWTLLNGHSDSGMFPCAAGAFPSVSSGYKAKSMVSTKPDGFDQTNDKEGSVIAPNAWGVLENGTLYAVRHDSQIGKLYHDLQVNMTSKENRSFIITYAENKNGENAIAFRA